MNTKFAKLQLYQIDATLKNLREVHGIGRVSLGKMPKVLVLTGPRYLLG
jgi:hypothetical protein